jgi:hypothetical protein
MANKPAKRISITHKNTENYESSSNFKKQLENEVAEYFSEVSRIYDGDYLSSIDANELLQGLEPIANIAAGRFNKTIGDIVKDFKKDPVDYYYTFINRIRYTSF